MTWSPSPMKGCFSPMSRPLEKDRFLSDLRRLMPEVAIIEVPASRISLADANESYLFNEQLVTLPEGGMALVVPSEARDNAAVGGWLQEMVAGNGPRRGRAGGEVRGEERRGGKGWVRKWR